MQAQSQHLVDRGKQVSTIQSTLVYSEFHSSQSCVVSPWLQWKVQIFMNLIYINKYLCIYLITSLSSFSTYPSGINIHFHQI